MAEPISSTSTGIAGLSLTLTGSIFGLHYDAMFAGFFAALIAQTYVPAGVSRVRGFFQLVAAGGVSGFFSPLAVAVATKVAPWPLPTDALQLAVGATLGFVAPIAVPLVRKFVTGVVDKTSEGGKP